MHGDEEETPRCTDGWCDIPAPTDTARAVASGPRRNDGCLAKHGLPLGGGLGRNSASGGCAGAALSRAIEERRRQVKQDEEKRRTYGKGRIFRRGKTLWIAYCQDGV